MGTMGDTILGVNTPLAEDGEQPEIAANSGENAENKPKLIKKRASGLPRMGKPKLPDASRRVFVSVRVLPKTKDALESMGAKNLGWALDSLVDMAKEAGLFKIPTTFI